MANTDRVIRNASDHPGVGYTGEEEDVVVGAGGWTEKRFVEVSGAGAYISAPIDSAFVVGVAPRTIAAGERQTFDSSKLTTVVADAILAARDDIKVGIGGRATKYNSSATTLDAAFSGAATALTQPGAAATLEILQAADVAGDRGRVVRVVGGDASGNVIYDDITLDASNTTTVVAGTVSFTTVAGAYMVDEAVAGAQNITIREADDTGVCTITGATVGVGVEVHASSPVEVHCSELSATGPNADATFITYFGILAGTDVLGGERIVFDGASPSVATTVLKFRTFIGIFSGEATNGGSFLNVVTVADSASEKLGFVTAAVAARGSDGIVVFDIDAVNPPNITALAARVTVNEADLVTNTADIATNTAGVATNVTDVATNATDIATLQSQVGYQQVTATGDIGAKRCVAANAGTYVQGAIDDLNVMGATVGAIAGAASGDLDDSNLLTVEASAPLASNDVVKVGELGKVTLYNSSAVDMDDTIAGAATAVTQPGAAATLEVFQANDVAGDRGRVVRVVGGDAGGLVIYEDFTLDASNTTTVVVGATSFTTVAGAFMLDGSVSGAEDITVREADDTGVATITAANLGIGMEVPATTIQAYCQELEIEGPDTDSTYVTVFGLLTDLTVGGERIQLDGSSPSKTTGAIQFITVTNILLGEATNAGAFLLKTNPTTDTVGMRIGVNVSTVAARGNDATIIFKPNIGF